MTAVFADHDRDGGRRATRREPVAPADNEASVIAESAARKIVLATAARNSSAEFGHRRSTGKCVETTENPDSEKHPHVGEQPGDVAGRSNDAGGNGVADGGGHSEPHAENLEEASAIDNGSGANPGRSFRRFRQCGVSRDARN